VADWQDAQAYAPLLEADRSIFAWEWLRRDPLYRAAAWTAVEGPRAEDETPRPERWGLHEFERPDRAAPDARPVWCVDIHPYVLGAVAAGAKGPDDAFDLERFGLTTRIATGAVGREHLLISDGLRAIRIDVLAGTLSEGPVELRYLLAGLVSAERPVLTLRRLLALRRTGNFSRALHRPETRARRWLITLRTAAALAAGADQRGIAEVLLSRTAGEPRWRANASSVRSQVQRLVAGARQMTKGGYRRLLQ